MRSYREKILFICFVFALFMTGRAFGAESCVTPAKSDLTEFFRGVEHWTEVEAEDLNRPAENKPIEFFIDFNDPYQSKIFMDGEDMGQFASVCETNSANQIRVLAQGKTIKITRTSYGLKSEVAWFVFHYRPHREVFS